MAAVIQDVALQSGGVLKGQVHDAQGVPQGGIAVALLKDGTAVAAVVADDAGRFAIRDLSAGTYHLQTPVTSAVYRVWAPGTAPPAAQDAVLVIADEQVVRGAGGAGMLANPWVLAIIVAAAIAIPLAVDSDGS